jgi:general secretion pathway protein J
MKYFNSMASQTHMKGFTLIELLVSLGAMALLSVLTWQGVDTLLRSRDINQSQTEQASLVQMGLRQWQMDLDATQPIPDLLAQAPIYWDGRVLRILRRAPTPQASGSDQGLCVVAWTQRDGQWLRWQSSALLTRSQVQQAWQAAGQWGQNPVSDLKRSETALMAANGWQLLYYRDNAWTHPLSGMEADQRLPDAVRMVMKLSPPSGSNTPVDVTLDWINPAFNPNRT